MPITFGATPAEPSLDQLLALLGIRGGQPQPQAAPSASMSDGSDPIGALIAASGGQQMQGQPPQQQMQQPQQMQAPQQQQPGMDLPPPPQWAHRNIVGDTLDNLFLHGAIQAARSQQYKHETDAYTRQLGALALQRQFAAIRSLPAGIPQALATLNPDKFAEEASKSATTPGGDTTTFMGDPNSRFTAPKYSLDPVSGKTIVQGPAGTQVGQSVGGGYKVDAGSGGLYSERTGAVSSVLPQFHSAPVTDNAGFNAPPGAAIPSAFGSASGAGGQGSPPPPPSSPAPILSAAFRRLESGGNDAAQNGSSTGRYQFKPATFNALMPGGNINDPAQQETALGKLMGQNTTALQRAGLPVTDANLYLLHQQGAPGGVAILQNPQKNAVQALTDAGIYKNPAIARRAITRNYGTANMTGADFANMWSGKVARAVRRSGTAGDAGVATGAPGGAPVGSGGFSSGWQGKGYTSNPDGSQTSPIGKNEATPTMLTPNDALTMGKGVRDDESYKMAKESASAFNAMLALKGQKLGGMRAYALRDTFARTINPGAVARAGTIEAIKQSQGVPANIQAYLMNLRGDGDVPPEIADQIIAAAAPFAQSHWDEANDLNQHYAGIATKAHLDPQMATAPLGPRPAIPSAGRPSITPEAARAELIRRGLKP